MSELRLLRRMRKLLTDPSKWTKGYYARNKQGEDVSARSRGAVCFCLLGALQAESVGAKELHAAKSVLMKVVQQEGHPHIHAFNDSDNTQHEDVLRVLDKAIEQAS